MAGATAAIIAGGGLSAAGGVAESKNQRAIAEQNLQFARETRMVAMNVGTEAVIRARKQAEDARRLAEPTPAELRAMQNEIQVAERAIQRQEKLFAALDPVLVESARNTLNLLKGKEAEILTPLKAQRQRQRDQLVQTLRDRLGAGFETSTAGQTALQRFDEQTQALTANAQMQALQSLNQTTSTIAGARPSSSELVSIAGVPSNRLAQLTARRLDAFQFGANMEQNALGLLQSGVTQTPIALQPTASPFGQAASNLGAGLTTYGAFEMLSKPRTESVPKSEG